MSSADEHLMLIKKMFPNIRNNGNNAFNFGAFPEIYDENGNLRDKFKKQILTFAMLKEKRKL